MAVSAAEAAEIKRKAAAGIPLTNPTAETKALYNQAKAATQPVSSAQAAEVARKAAAGIPLTNPTAATTALYAQSQAAASTPKAAAPQPVSAAQQAEIERKAAAGIPLTNPTATTTALYEKAVSAVKGAVQAVTGKTTAATPATTDRAKREQQRADFTGWDNNPEARTLQEKAWAVYVDTGKWNTPDQLEWNQQAEKIRKYNNPMYGGSSWGPSDWMEAEKITPRDTTPGANTAEGLIDKAMEPSNWGNIAAVGLFAFVALMFFRR